MTVVSERSRETDANTAPRITENVAEQTRVEEALRARERELSQLVDMVPAHLWRLSPDGELLFFNKRMADFVGLGVNETKKPGMTRPAALIEAAVHPEDQAAFGAALLGHFEEGAFLLVLFALGGAGEEIAMDRARKAIEALAKLAPDTATVRDASGTDRLVNVKELRLGDHVVVNPSERVPADGEVISGESSIDQSPITGESVPVDKAPGAQVFAGTINGDSALEARSTKAAGDTTLAQIIRLVGEASGRRAASERWVDRFARVYTPAVMLVALAVLLVPPLLVGQPWQPWIYRSLVFLVIGCPCALVISTPVTIVAALAAAAKHGVLIKGGIHVETPASLQAVALDKTGTLTEGRPRVETIVALAGHHEREILADVAGMESQSDHPISKSN